MQKRVIGLLVFVLLIYDLIFSGTGSTGWPIFRKIESPKPKSITTVVRVGGDLLGILYNPSILSTMEKREFYTIADLGISEDITGGIMYGHPLKNSAISAGVFYYDAGKSLISWIENGQVVEREISFQKDMLFSISYARIIMSKISTGISLKFASSKIAEVAEANAYACDLGLSYFANDKITISLAGQNLGVSEKFVDREEKLPMTAYFSIGYNNILPSDYYYAAGLDVSYIIEEEKFIPSVGIEIGRFPLGIIVAYKNNVEEGNFSIGLSMKLKQFVLGYSFIPTRLQHSAHRVSFGWRF